MNTATFCGRLGRDAELKYTPQGKAVCNFSIAVDVGFGDNKKTLWIGGVLWEKRAEGLAEHLTKGKMICMTGPIELRTWINSHTGEAQGQIECKVREVTLCSGGDKKNAEGSQPEPKSNESQAGPISDEDIPF